MSSLKPRVAGCWLVAPPVHLTSLANGNTGHSGKGGVHSSRKQWLGEGCEFMLHILWIGAHGREGGNRPGPPTNYSLWAHHYSQHSSCYRTIRTLWPNVLSTDKIHTRPLHQKSPQFPPQFPPTPCRGKNFHVTLNGNMQRTWVELELQLRDMRGQSEPTITKRCLSVAIWSQWVNHAETERHVLTLQSYIFECWTIVQFNRAFLVGLQLSLRNRKLNTESTRLNPCSWGSGGG